MIYDIDGTSSYGEKFHLHRPVSYTLTPPEDTFIDVFEGDDYITFDGTSAGAVSQEVGPSNESFTAEQMNANVALEFSNQNSMFFSFEVTGSSGGRNLFIDGGDLILENGVVQEAAPELPELFLGFEPEAPDVEIVAPEPGTYLLLASVLGTALFVKRRR